jgi:hypothetical protein
VLATNVNIACLLLGTVYRQRSNLGYINTTHFRKICSAFSPTCFAFWRLVFILCSKCLNFEKVDNLPTKCNYVFHIDLRITAKIALHNINWVTFIAQKECVFCAVRTASSHIHAIKINMFETVIYLEKNF